MGRAEVAETVHAEPIELIRGWGCEDDITAQKIIVLD